MARIGAFELAEPVPELRSPRLLVTLQPWVNVGSVGTLTLAHLQDRWGARELGRLARPGEFYDFTRYRPVIRYQDGERRVTVPNSVLHAARDGGDWLFLQAMEPHAHGEDFCDALVEVVRRFGVREYWLIGAMYGPVPHTRPPVLSGSVTDEGLRDRLAALGIRSSSYEGPTTILATLPDALRSLGVAAGTLLVQLPAYAQLDSDYHGRYVLLSKLDALFGLGLDLEGPRRVGEEQYAALSDALAKNPDLQGLVHQLEAAYDREAGAPGEGETKLSPELERFLRELEQRWEGQDRD